jgi:hypothetical protein
VAARLTLFRLGRPSLLRGVLLALGSLAASLLLAGFLDVANLHASPWQFAVAAFAALAMAETARCLGRRWSFYHAGVLILLYTELTILAMVLFLALCL